MDRGQTYLLNST